MSRGVSVGVGSAVGSSVGCAAEGVVAPEGGVDVELRLTFARLWVDQRPCIERFRAFELCLDICERVEETRLLKVMHAQISP